MPMNNLPSQPTSFVGREKELADIATLLANPNCRLLTLVGAGGIGKTRLAMQAAVDQEPHFADGVCFVPLAPITSTDLLPAAIAGALGISFYGPDEPHIQLAQYLREKQILLAIDNFEHLLDGTGLLTELLHAAPDLKILTTSRERLNLQEEWVFALDGLSYPINSSIDSLENYSAVQLFVQRAHQVNNHFSIDENTLAVQLICRQVEGMPLGLELAASWLRVMSCQQIEAQIASNLDFLTTSLRNIPERHRSLRAVFTQSWNFLTQNEQSVLMKLSVFRGGFDLEAAEQVAGASLPLLAGLADKSLIRLNASGRYDLHELLRQYAAEYLLDAGLAAVTTQQHIDYFLKFAEQAEAHLFGREQIVWFDRLEVEMDSLRAALARSAESEVGLKLAASLGWFFSERSYRNEGLVWLEQTLVANPNASASLRSKALARAGLFAGYFGDVQRAYAYAEEAIVLARTINDVWNLAWSLSHSGLGRMERNLKESAIQLEESISLFRKLEDPMGLAHTLVRLAWNAINQKNISYSCILIDEAANLISRAGDIIMGGWVAETMGRIAKQQQNFKQAKIHFERAISQFRQAHFPIAINNTLMSLAHVEMANGELDLAQRHYRQSLISHASILPNHAHVLIILAGFGRIAKAHRNFERAAQLFAAAYDEIEWMIQWSQIDYEFIPYQVDIVAVRDQMGQAAFDEAWTLGRAMTRQQAIAYALEDSASPTKILSTVPVSNQTFTDRELEILCLLSDGLNSREIAQRLVLSVGTIRWYLKQIYSKLDAHSRSEAIARAKALKLLV